MAEYDIAGGEEPSEYVQETAVTAEAFLPPDGTLPEEASPHEGPVIAGTWVNPNVPGYVPRQPAPRRGELDLTLPVGRPSVVRMLFGSIVVLSDEIAERAAIGDEDDAPRRVAEAAIRQAAGQQQALDRRPFADLRYMTIGMLGGGLDRVQNGAGLVSEASDAVARAAGRIISPVWNSFLFAPLHRPLQQAEQAGENKVDAWIRRGRVEEVRSRALAEVSINNLVEESVTDITNNPQVQVLVQEIIASQSTSLVGEVIEEIRERMVTLDLKEMERFHPTAPAPPDFRADYLRQFPERRPQFARRDLIGSLAGTYAGPISRLGAFLIDVVILILVVGLISAFVSSTLNLFGLTDLLHNFLRSGGPLATALLIFVALFNFLVIAVYFVGGWHLAGTTVGDALMGLRVVSVSGERVSLWRSIMRLIGFVLSAVVLFIGFIWALFDSRRQGWHDKLGGTVVIYDWPARPDERFLRAEPLPDYDS